MQVGGTLSTDYTKTYLFKARLAFIAALVMVGVVFVSVCLAAVSEYSPRCRGQELPEVYYIWDLVVLCLVAAAIAAMIGGLAFGVRDKVGTFPEIGNLPIPFEFVAYRVLLMALVILAIVTGLVIAHCHDILSTCALLAAPH